MTQNGGKAPTTIEEQCDFLVNYALGTGCEEASVGIDCDEGDMEGLNGILSMCNTGNTPTTEEEEEEVALPPQLDDYDDDDLASLGGELGVRGELDAATADQVCSLTRC
jgi:hypothetical protein